MPIEERNISTVAMDAASRYAAYVTKNRQFADYRDGLLPVQRHIIWAAHLLDKSRTGKFIKTAKLVGDVLGNYHPHSGEAIADSVAGLTAVNSIVNPLEGDGNFGSRMGDAPASMRYTDARLSKYGITFVDKDYLKCVPYVSNYTGTEKIPVYLPSLLPNILLNGTFGIGYGAMACIPTFTKESVAKIVNLAFKRELKAADCSKILEPCFISGAVLERTPALDEFYKTGAGSYKLCPQLSIVDGDVIITGFYELNLDALTDKLTNDPMVKSVSDISDGSIKILVQVRNKSKVTTNKVWQLVHSALTCTQPLQANVIENDIPDGYESDNETLPSKFTMYNIPDLIHKWVAYRTKLEQRRLQIVLEETQAQRNRVDILIQAAARLPEFTKLLQERLTTLELKTRVGKMFHANGDAVNHLLVNTSILRIAHADQASLKNDSVNLGKTIRETHDSLGDLVNTARNSIAGTFSRLP